MRFLNITTVADTLSSMPEFSNVAPQESGLSFWSLALTGGWLMIPLVLL